MESRVEIDRFGKPPNLRKRDGIGENLSPNLTFFTDVPKIGGYPITDVDHGGGQFVFPEPIPNFDTRHWMEMLCILAVT